MQGFYEVGSGLFGILDGTWRKGSLYQGLQMKSSTEVGGVLSRSLLYIYIYIHIYIYISIYI